MFKDLIDPRLRFWRWFTQNETRYLNFDPSEGEKLEPLFNDFARHLAKVDRNLVFEFGPNSTPRELVISADGIRTAFSAVTALVAAAPNLEKWKITAFRPRHPLCTIQIEDIRVDPNDVQFTLLEDGEQAGIFLFIPGYDESRVAYKQIGYLLLDSALGEFDVETKVGLIKMLSPEADVSGDRRPLPKLGGLFDQLMEQLKRSDPRA